MWDGGVDSGMVGGDCGMVGGECGMVGVTVRWWG